MWPLSRKKPVDPSSENALKDAQQNLEQIRKRTPEVEATSRKLRIIREKNHFTERLRPIMLEGGPPDGA